MDVLLEAPMGATHASHGLTREGQPWNVSRRSLRNGFTAAPGKELSMRDAAPGTAVPRSTLFVNDNFFVLRRRDWEGISRAAVNTSM
jgi:hypothetical protein